MVYNTPMDKINEQKGLLDQAKAEGNPDIVCEILGNLARTLIDLGQAEEALPYLDDAIRTAEKHNLIKLKANNLGNRGVALVHLNRMDQAREHFEQVQEIAQEINEPSLSCDALIQQAIMHLEIPRGDLVQKDLMDALVIAESIEDPKRQMNIHALLGHNHFNIASFDESAKFFLKALEFAEQTENQMAQAGYHHNLGNVFYSANAFNEAVNHFYKALEIFREIGDEQGEKNTLLRLVKSLADNDEPEKTCTYAQEGLELTRKLEDKTAYSVFFNLLIITTAYLGRLDDTLELVDDAMKEAEKDGDLDRKLNLFVSKGNTHFELDDYEKAKEAYLEGLDISVRLQKWELQTRLLGRLSAVEAELGSLDHSIIYAQEALGVAERIGNRKLIGEQLMMLAFCARDKGAIEEAREYAEKAQKDFTLIESKAALEKVDQFLIELEGLV